TPVNRTSMVMHWASLLQCHRWARHDAVHDVTVYSFRKLVATVLDDAGLSARMTADVLQHADPAMTQRSTWLVGGLIQRLMRRWIAPWLVMPVERISGELMVTLELLVRKRPSDRHR